MCLCVYTPQYKLLYLSYFCNNNNNNNNNNNDNIIMYNSYMGGMYGCGEQEVGVASGSGWNVWVW